MRKYLNLSVNFLKSAFIASKPIEIRFHIYSNSEERAIFKILKKLLGKKYSPKALNALQYCIRELITNGEKANIKRVFFLENQLDENNQNDYRKGMESFNQELKSKRRYLTKLIENQKYIHLRFQRSGDVFNISLRNNSIISSQESNRIDKRLKGLDGIDNILDAYDKFSDSSEGAGLGILTIGIALKRIGIPPSNLSIRSFEDYTEARIVVPYRKESTVTSDKLSRMLLAEKERLVSLPESLKKVLRMFEKPKKNSKSDILKQLASDDALYKRLIESYNLLYSENGSKAISGESLIKRLGHSKLRNIVLYEGIKMVSEHHGLVRNELWDHMFKTARYTLHFCKLKRSNAKSTDAACLAALLHDIGKFAFFTVTPERTKRISNICKKKGISTDILEDALIGIQHAELGGAILKKLGFPKSIVNPVIKHHNLFQISSKEKPIVYPLYISNYLANPTDMQKTASFLPYEIKQYYRIQSEKDFSTLVDAVEKRFAAH